MYYIVMVLFDQPTHFKHSIFKPVREFKETKNEEDEPDHGEEEYIPEIKESKYLPGERLLKKINKDRKRSNLIRSKKKKKTISPHTIDRISQSLARTVRQLTE
jgi:hypothetical protein